MLIDCSFVEYKAKKMTYSPTSAKARELHATTAVQTRNKVVILCIEPISVTNRKVIIKTTNFSSTQSTNAVVQGPQPSVRARNC